MLARRKLQEKMEGILHDPQNTGIEHRPEELKDKAFDSHSDAYLEAGLPELGWLDALTIASESRNELGDPRTRKEVWEVTGPFLQRKIEGKDPWPYD